MREKASILSSAFLLDLFAYFLFLQKIFRSNLCIPLPNLIARRESRNRSSGLSAVLSIFSPIPLSPLSLSFSSLPNLLSSTSDSPLRKFQPCLQQFRNLVLFLVNALSAVKSRQLAVPPVSHTVRHGCSSVERSIRNL